jgi:hypothetical protein
MKRNLNATRDPNTSDMFPVKRGRGRPKKADALTNAERQRLFRERQKIKALGPTAQLRDLSVEVLAGTFADLVYIELAAKRLLERYGASEDMCDVVERSRRAADRFEIK